MALPGEGGPLVLVVNSGSSSLKLSLTEPVSGQVRISALAEGLGSPAAVLHVRAASGEAVSAPLAGRGHAEAMEQALDRFDTAMLRGVGHRVVHGGEMFSDSTLIDGRTLAAIEACVPLAPLHNPANLAAIGIARARFRHIPHVAVFDTAFHQSMPRRAFLYAIPWELYERHKIRRYGFHGTSHRFVSARAAELLAMDPGDLQLISAHLGNGCSACAIRNGGSVDTTMGLTPLEGLVMGTRSGDVDPNLHSHLARTLRLPLEDTTALLNRGSGLLGLSGISNDMRDVLKAAAAGHEKAGVAVEVFCHRLAKGILGLAASLDRLDAVVFTGGIGENAAEIRSRTLGQLAVLGLRADEARNAVHGRDSGGRITPGDGRPCALVVPTNEELVIARETARFLETPPPSAER